MAAASRHTTTFGTQNSSPLLQNVHLEEPCKVAQRKFLRQRCAFRVSSTPSRRRAWCQATVALKRFASSSNVVINNQIVQPAFHVVQYPALLELHSSRQGRGSRLRAVKKSSQTDVSKDDEWDPDFVEAMNELCNKAARVMLSEDLQLVNQLRTELDTTGATLVEHGEIDAARFILVVQEMLDHKLAPERKMLTGRFNEAFEKIYGLVEDAGWSLQPPEEDGQEREEFVEDDVLRDAEPPVAPKKTNEPYNRTFQAQDQFV